MRIAVMGAGGIGSCMGGLLARAGEDVTLIARGRNLEAIREKGLKVKSLDFGEFHLTIPVTDSPSDVGEVDLVLFCVKSYDTVEAAKQVRPLIGPDTVILSIQNGVDQEDVIADIVGEEHVIGAVSMLTAHAEEPGAVFQQVNLGILLGELEGGVTPRIEKLVGTLENAGIKSMPRPDIRVAMWEKFAAFCSISGLETVTRLPAGPILACPESRELVYHMLLEIEAVAKASGIELYTGFVEKIQEFINALPPTHRPSMYLDMIAGKRIELAAINGTLVRLGQEHRVPIPLNFAIYAALKPYENGTPETH